MLKTILSYSLRISLFLATNIAIVLVASVTLSLLGVKGYLKGGGEHAASGIQDNATNGIQEYAASGIDFNALLILCFVIGVGGAFVSLLLSKIIAKWSTRTRLIGDSPKNNKEAMLLQSVKQLAQQANIGMPDVGIFPAEQANAFATGFNRNRALVSISEGMLERYSDSEIKAVLAHEVSHIANGDMITMTLLQGVINTFVMFLARVIGYAVDKAVFKTKEGVGLGYYAVVILCEIVLSILASIIVMWFSRVREYRADKGAARMAGAESMIAALAHLQKESEMPSEMPKSLNAFGIASGKLGFSIANLFMTHPPLDKRIEALRKGY